MHILSGIQYEIVDLCGFQVNLNSDQLGKLKVKDGQLCKEHLAEMSAALGDAVELSEGIFRRYEDDTQCHVANYMYEIGQYAETNMFKK